MSILDKKNIFKLIGVVVILLVVVLAFSQISAGDDGEESQGENSPLKKVSIISVKDFENGTGSISAVGEVSSLEQVELSAQVSEKVNSIRVQIGDQVVVGQTLVSLDNAELVAGRDQAQASLDAENARLLQLERGARTQDVAIKENQLDQSKESLANEYTTVVDTLHSAYIVADDAVHVKAGDLFTGFRTTSYNLSFNSCDLQLENSVEEQRMEIEEGFIAWNSELEMISTRSAFDELDTAIASSKEHLDSVKLFLDNLNRLLTLGCVLNNPDFDGYRTNVNAARTAVNTSIASTNSKEQDITSEQLTVRRIEEELSLTLEGAREEEIAAQNARVKAAQAVLASANARLAKTIIRSPISGTVASVPIDLGDLVNPGQLLVSVVNTSGLEIKAYVSSKDRALVEEGSRVVIENGIEGIISRIAPSIDPSTKKVEIRIVIPDEKAPLVVGQFVNVKIPIHADASGSAGFMLPLSSVRITSTSPVVLVLDEQNIVQLVPVETGKVIGDTVEVFGLSGGVRILSNIRGIEVGERVDIEE